MSGAAATNRVSTPAHSHMPQHSGIAVNAAIPVGGMAPWRREAIKKAISFNSLPVNWDSYGSHAPGRAVLQTAIDLLRTVPGETLPVPRVVPVSGGGLHFEWAVGPRELEIAIGPDGVIEVLRVQDGMPLEEDEMDDLPAIFAWLNSQ